MARWNLTLITFLCLIVAAPVAMADKRPDGAERQQAVEHQREVQRMKEREQEHSQERRNQADKDREKLKVLTQEQAEEEQGLDGDAHGNEKAEEMRARRDERTAIKEEYDANRDKGDEGVDRELDAEDRDEEQKEKAKKPWWKFWGD